MKDRILTSLLATVAVAFVATTAVGLHADRRHSEASAPAREETTTSPTSSTTASTSTTVSTSVKVTVVASDPALLPSLNKGKEAIEKWYPTFVDAIVKRDYSPPNHITLTTTTSCTCGGQTSGTRIEMDEAWTRRADGEPEYVGAVLHETVHVVQSYSGATPGWVTEGVADWVRHNVYKDHPTPPPEAQKTYLDGYSEAADLIEFVRTTYKKPDLPHDLNVRAHDGKYSDAFWYEQTGKNLSELWAETVATPRSQ